MRVKQEEINNGYPMDKLLARLSEQQAVLNQQNEALKSRDDDMMYSRVFDHASSSNSLPVTPATDAFPTTAPTTRPASATFDDARSEKEEVLRLKLQLAQAQTHITKLDHELAQTRTASTEPELQGFAVPPRGVCPPIRESAWATQDDARSDTSDALSATAFNRARGIWGISKPSYNNPVPHPHSGEPSPANWFGRGFNQGYMEPNGPYQMADGYRGDRITPDSDMLMRSTGGRRGNRYDTRINTPQPFNNGYGGYPGPGGPAGPGGQYEPMSGPMPTGPMNPPPGPGPMSMGMYPQYQQSVGTPLSPHASEFTSKSAWKTEVS